MLIRFFLGEAVLFEAERLKEVPYPNDDISINGQGFSVNYRHWNYESAVPGIKDASVTLEIHLLPD